MSEKKYSILYRTLIFLFVLAIISGVLIAMVCEYIKVLTQNRIFQFDKREALNVFFLVKLYGIHVSFYFVGGLSILSVFDDVYTCHMRLLVKIWVLLAVEMAIGSLFVVWCFTDVTKSVTEHFEDSLKEGIKLYPHHPVWVLIWDDMQYEFKCCGIYNHTDWTRVRLSKDRKRKNDNSLLPFSCAISNVPVKLSLSDDQINKDGCLRVLSRTINTVKDIVVTLNAFILVLLVSPKSLKKCAFYIFLLS